MCTPTHNIPYETSRRWEDVSSGMTFYLVKNSNLPCKYFQTPPFLSCTQNAQWSAKTNSTMNKELSKQSWHKVQEKNFEQSAKQH